MATRRRPGLAGLRRKAKTKEQVQKKADELKGVKLEHVEKQLAQFEENLTRFAQKHRAEINENPVFRRRFHKMCVDVGVDPLASHKGFWAHTLGMGDFYFELSVQAVEVCIQTRAQNGGLLDLAELVALLRERRGPRAQRIGRHDVKYAIRKLGCLGSGFRVIRVGRRRKMVLSVPTELSTDHTLLLEHAEPDARISAAQARQQLGWSDLRFRAAIEPMMREGMAWLDRHGGQDCFWFPSLFFGHGGLAGGAAAAAGGDGEDDEEEEEDDDDDDDVGQGRIAEF